MPWVVVLRDGVYGPFPLLVDADAWVSENTTIRDSDVRIVRLRTEREEA